jgi:hypothetical protein
MANQPKSFWVWAPWALIGLFLFVGLWIWEAWPPGIWHDDGVYVLLGRSLAEGEGLRYVGIPGEPLAPKFPPLFPTLLGFVWLAFPTFPDNIPLLSGVNLVLTALTAGIFFSYLRRGLGIPAFLSAATTVLVWLSAHIWRTASIPLSEPLFLLGLTWALWVGGRMEEREGPKPVALFLLAGALVLHTRTLGVAVLAAGVVGLLLARRVKAAFFTGLGSVGIALPWVLWSRGAAETIPEPLFDVLGPYGNWLMAQSLQQPAEFALFLLKNSWHLLNRVITLLMPGASGPFQYLGLVLVAILILGFGELFRRSRLLPLTIAFSLGILVAWPFQEIRLLVPFQPFLMLALIMGFQGIISSREPGSKVRFGVAALALVWTVYFGSVSVLRLGDGWVGEAYRIRSEVLLDAVRAVEEKTPAEAVVGAPELWAALHLFTGRRVTPSARFLPLSAHGPSEGTPEEQYEIWIETGLTHLMVEHGGRIHGPALDRVDELCPPGTVVLLDNQPGRYLVALRWDEACRQRVLRGGR